VAVIAHSAIVVVRSRPEAADSQNDALFIARAALKRALAMRRDTETQVQQLRALVSRLEAECSKNDV
jgi:hypothetical protein